MHTYYFEKLEVWPLARIFVKEIYTATYSFPEEEKYGMTSQLRRTSLSIAANIAEDFSRNTSKDKARFINQAYSSAMEVVNFILFSQDDLSFLSEESQQEIHRQLSVITNKLNALYRTITQ